MSLMIPTHRRTSESLRIKTAEVRRVEIAKLTSELEGRSEAEYRACEETREELVT